MARRGKNQNTHIHGDWNAICDVCGFKFKASDLKERWDGQKVCADDWETRHPSDFERGVKDDPSVPWTRGDSNADSSYTDVGGTEGGQDNTPDTHGDVDATITYGTSHDIHVWDSELTAPRVCTIATGNAIEGEVFIIYKTTTGDTLEITDGTTIRTIPAAVEARVEVTYNGTSWLETAYTTIGL